MLSRADMSGIRPVAAIEAPTATVTIADAKHETVSRLAQIALGQQVQAKVLSAMEDGTFLVRIAGTTARMNLPVEAKAGDTLQLTLAGTAPRPTFLLGQQANAAATATVSATGRMIDQLLQSARQEGAPAALQGARRCSKRRQRRPKPARSPRRCATPSSSAACSTNPMSPNGPPANARWPS